MEQARPCYCHKFHRAVELIGRRWTGPILLALLANLHRFGEIRDAVPGLSGRLLSERLKELEAAGVVSRCTEHREISYRLTKLGCEVSPVLEAISTWAAKLPT